MAEYRIEYSIQRAEQTIWAAGAEPLTPHDIMPARREAMESDS